MYRSDPDGWARRQLEDRVKRFIVAIACIVALTAAYGAQAQQGRLASLIQAGDRKAALDMIRSGADVNEAQPDGTRPIHWAVYRVDYELMDALIAKKAKANVTNENEATIRNMVLASVCDGHCQGR